jgi:hypothetical protein
MTLGDVEVEGHRNSMCKGPEVGKSRNKRAGVQRVPCVFFVF